MNTKETPDDPSDETNAHADHKTNWLTSLLDYIERHKVRAFLIWFFVFSLGGPMSYFGTSPNILYLAPIALCALIMFVCHEGITKLKQRRSTAAEAATDAMTTLPVHAPTQPAPATPTPMNSDNRNINITSHGQSGGFTGINEGTLNLGPSPREVTEEQRTRFLSLMNGAPKGKVIVLAFSNNDEALKLASEFIALFKQAGFELVSDKPVGFMTYGGGNNVKMGIVDRAKIPDHAIAVQKGLEMLGFDAEGMGAVYAKAADVVEIQVKNKP